MSAPSIAVAMDPAGARAPATHVRLRGVQKVFESARGDVHALSDIDLDIREGEFLSLLGPSGCGKSTLLRCLAGLEEISGGEVLVRDEPLKGPPADMGIVLQRDMLLDWRSVLDNVFLPLEFRRKPTKPFRGPALRLLETFGLRRSVDRTPGSSRAACASALPSAARCWTIPPCS